MRYLEEKEGVSVITAIVKDDNAASWQAFYDNGFRRVSLSGLLRAVGMGVAFSQYFRTYIAVAMGMDLYLRAPSAREKRTGYGQISDFFLSNLIFGLALIPNVLLRQHTSPSAFAAAFVLMLGIYCIPRILAGLLYRKPSHLRVNTGGTFITLLAALLGTFVPVNLNWYPDKYERSRSFARSLALPELIRFGLFFAASLGTLSSNVFLNILGDLCLTQMIFPPFPCTRSPALARRGSFTGQKQPGEQKLSFSHYG